MTTNLKKHPPTPFLIGGFFSLNLSLAFKDDWREWILKTIQTPFFVELSKGVLTNVFSGITLIFIGIITIDKIKERKEHHKNKAKEIPALLTGFADVFPKLDFAARNINELRGKTNKENLILISHQVKFNEAIAELTKIAQSISRATNWQLDIQNEIFAINYAQNYQEFQNAMLKFVVKMQLATPIAEAHTKEAEKIYPSGKIDYTAIFEEMRKSMTTGVNNSETAPNS